MSTAAVELLARLAPQALTMANKDGRLPLHFAAEHQGGAEGAAVVELLARPAPQALTVGDSLGSLPLHFAACYQGGGKGTAVVEVLAMLCPQALTTGDNDGFFPLHIAARCQGGKKGTGVVELLTQLCPQAVTVGADNGRLPLHLARDEAVANCLLSLWDGAAYHANSAGLLPVVTVTGLTRRAMLRAAPLTALHFRGHKITKRDLLVLVRRAVQQVRLTMVSVRKRLVFGDTRDRDLLLPAIIELCEAAAVHRRDLKAIAVSTGPEIGRAHV